MLVRQKPRIIEEIWCKQAASEGKRQPLEKIKGRQKMTLTISEVKLLPEIEKLAREAGRMFLEADLSGHVTVTTKSGRRDLVTSMDVKIQEFLMQRLAMLVPSSSFLCEEDLSLSGIRQVKDPAEAEGVCFIIDPIDGTANFVHGMKHSCTSIAMAAGGQVRIGVIYDPYRDELFSAVKGRGAWLNGRLLEKFDAGLADAIIAFGTAPYDDANNEETFRMGHRMYEISADVRRSGSAALDQCWTACGRYGLYAELGLSPWDIAAGMLIAEETGCLVSDIDGAPVKLNGRTTYLCGRPTSVREFLEDMATAGWRSAEE